MKQLLALVLLVTAGLAQAWDQRAPNPVEQCQVHSPYGFAQTARTAQPICLSLIHISEPTRPY